MTSLEPDLLARRLKRKADASAGAIVLDTPKADLSNGAIVLADPPKADLSNGAIVLADPPKKRTRVRWKDSCGVVHRIVRPSV